MDFTLENIYHILLLSLCLLFSLYLLFNQTKGRLENIYIGLFIFYMGLENLDVILGQTPFYRNYPNLYLIIPTLAFLIYPILFFYIKSIAFRGFKLSRKDIIHAVPFLFIVVMVLSQYHFRPIEIKRQIMTDVELKPWFVTVIYYGLHIQALVYLVLAIKVTLRFRTIVKENYSTIKKRNYKWILQLTYVFLYFVITALVYNIMRFGIDITWEKKLFFVFAPINLAFIIWLIYKAMSQPYLFNGVDANIKLLKEYIIENDYEHRNQEGRVNTEDFDSSNSDLKFKLEKHMQTEEVFLDPSLTIFKLAKGLNTSSMELSLFLNKALQKNFFDFINEYRIEKAKKLLIANERRDHTVLEILYEVGFNSKSSFNTAFKKYTQLTPTQYRQKHLKSSA